MATGTLAHGFEPGIVAEQLGCPAPFVTRVSDYLFTVDCDQSALDAAISAAQSGDASVLMSRTVNRIKLSARAHILASLPEWKQANATARGLELTRIGMTRALTEPEQAELAGLEYAWAWVKSIRTLSDVAEAELAGMTRAELDAWTEPSWPEWGA